MPLFPLSSSLETLGETLDANTSIGDASRNQVMTRTEKVADLNAFFGLKSDFNNKKSKSRDHLPCTIPTKFQKSGLSL